MTTLTINNMPNASEFQDLYYAKKDVEENGDFSYLFEKWYESESAVEYIFNHISNNIKGAMANAINTFGHSYTEVLFQISNVSYKYSTDDLQDIIDNPYKLPEYLLTESFYAFCKNNRYIPGAIEMEEKLKHIEKRTDFFYIISDNIVKFYMEQLEENNFHTTKLSENENRDAMCKEYTYKISNSLIQNTSWR